AGVEIQWVENTGPYRKLLPTLEHVGDEELIVTADDDILYAPTRLEPLRAEALERPTVVVAARARYMVSTPWGGWRNFRLWPHATRDAVGQRLLPLDGAGTVYRKPMLDLDFLTDRAFLDLAPRNDNLWYRVATLRRGIPVAVRP